MNTYILTKAHESLDVEIIFITNKLTIMDARAFTFVVHKIKLDDNNQFYDDSDEDNPVMYQLHKYE